MDHQSVKLNGGAAMPMVGFGTWRLRGREAYEAVGYALQAGYRHIDTATMYGNETEVGQAVRDSGLRREEIFLTTKLMPGDAGRERAVIEESLRALGTDYLDLWLIHAPPGSQAGLSTWQAFLAFRDEGLARTVGVSNYELGQLDLLSRETGEIPAVNQVPWSPSLHDPRQLEGHRERGVVLEGYSPLKGTRLDDPVLVDVARRHAVTPAQVVLRWHLEHGIPVIPKSGDRGRITTNIDLFDFQLSGEDIARIDAL